MYSLADGQIRFTDLAILNKTAVNIFVHYLCVFSVSKYLLWELLFCVNLGNVFWMSFTFKIWVSRLPSIMWVGFILSVEGLNRTNFGFLKQQGIIQQMVFGFYLHHQFSWVFNLLALITDLELPASITMPANSLTLSLKRN